MCIFQDSIIMLYILNILILQKLSNIKSISPLRQRSVTKESVSTMDLGSKEDYIYLAASHICKAKGYEANGDYEQAFATYKSCVGILLQGVQGMSLFILVTQIRHFNLFPAGRESE